MRRRLQALAALTIINAFFATVVPARVSDAGIPISPIAAVLLMLGVYLLARSRWYSVAIQFITLAVFLTPLIFLTSGRIFMLRQLVISYMIASIFIPRQFSFVLVYAFACVTLTLTSFFIEPLSVFISPGILAGSASYVMVVIFVMTAVQRGDLAELEEMAKKARHEASYRKALIDNIPGLVYTVTSDYRLTDAMGTGSSILTGKVHDSVGASLPNSLPDPVWQLTKPHIDKVLKSREPLQYEVELPQPDKPTEWVENHLAPLIVDDEIIGVVTLVLDITSRKEAEYQSNVNSQLLQTVLDAIRVGVFIQQDETIVFHNQMVCALTGYHDEEIRALSLRELVAPELQELTRGWLLNSEDVMELTQAEIPLHDRFGKRLWVNLTLTNIEYRGRPAMLVAFVNATRNVEMHQAILQRERHFRSLIENSSDIIVLMDSTLNLTYISPAVERILGYKQEDWIGSRILETTPDIFHSDDLANLQVQLRQLTQQQDPIEQRLQMKHAEGHWVWIELIATNMLREPGIEAIIINAHDITTIQTALRAEREQRALSDALLNTAAALNSTLKLKEVLSQILENLNQIVPYEKANVALVEDDGTTKVVSHRGYTGEHLNSILSASFHIQKSFAYRRMIYTEDVCYIDDLEDVSGWTQLPGGDTKSYLGAPIILDEEVIGFLNLESPECCAFEEDSPQRLRQFTNHAALAIRNARAYEQGRALATNKERQRIAGDLHDAVSQTLFSASMISETLPLLYEHSPEDVLSGLHELSQLTKGALAEMRALLMELRPESFRRTDLRTLFSHLINGFQTRTDAVIHQELNDEKTPLSPDVRLNLYRITQEALNNIIRHAHATEIWISLQCDADSTQIVIRDNGRGFVPETVGSEHMGLRIMRERAQNHDIRLEIKTSPETGTTISAHYPGGEPASSESVVPVEMNETDEMSTSIPSNHK